MIIPLTFHIIFFLKQDILDSATFYNIKFSHYSIPKKVLKNGNN